MLDENSAQPQVGIIMGSRSDWTSMRCASEVLNNLTVPHECRVVSAHRTPDWMVEYAKSAQDRGLKVIIAGAGGAAHLPGMVASLTDLPVLGVPMQSRTLNGIDSLLSIAQMPRGVPVGTLAIGEAGAANAGLLAARILATLDPELAKRIQTLRKSMQRRVMDDVNLDEEMKKE
ncbi:N5-carboxyaminoimidazole ribonucleotide mutase [Symmachiella macrocystis]|uniref:N5-carboxyaminoimidazole ribonucleotide mutase n=1 Tax=Symmachiella macrocystis TaxID=2527985 RepID=A0A5C6BRN3_9PLAN|nr:N5-carboxyaminoimidazole ribonucleotide mutase [Symmachiella macrocystis]